MKTSAKLQKLVTLVATLLIATSFASAQRLDEMSGFNEPNDPNHQLTSFSATIYTGKAYINWTVLSKVDKYLYLLERSNDGINFSTIGMKKGAPSPNNLELLFSFIDEEPLEGSSFYRLVFVNENGETIVHGLSKEISNRNNENIMAFTN